MKKLPFILFTLLLMCAAVVFGADVIPVAAVPATTVATVATAASTTVGFLDWFKLNSAVVLGFVLALSEVLSLIPAFKGNGILDTIIKALQALPEKPTTPAA